MNSKSKWCQDMETLAPEIATENTAYQIFIGGLSLDTTEADLVQLFRRTLGCVPDVRIMRFRDGRSRGFGFVQFWDSQEYQRALDVRSYFIKDTWVQCRASVALDEAARQAKELQKRKLIVVRISASISEDDLASHFAVFGTVIRAKIFRVSPNTVQFAQGYVEFATKASVSKILDSLHRPKVIAINSTPILIYSAEAKSSSTKNWKELFKAQFKKSNLRYPFFGSEKSVGISQKTTDAPFEWEEPAPELQIFEQEAAIRKSCKPNKISSKLLENNYRLNLDFSRISAFQELRIKDRLHCIVWKSLDMSNLTNVPVNRLNVIKEERETLHLSQRTPNARYIK